MPDFLGKSNVAEFRTNADQFFWGAESLHRVASRMVRIDTHINADGVIRNNRERSRGCTNEPGFAPLHIQNVIARRQRNAIVSILIRRNSRDFFFGASAQDDEWIQRIFASFHHGSRRVLIG